LAQNWLIIDAKTNQIQVDRRYAPAFFFRLKPVQYNFINLRPNTLCELGLFFYLIDLIEKTLPFQGKSQRICIKQVMNKCAIEYNQAISAKLLIIMYYTLGTPK